MSRETLRARVPIVAFACWLELAGMSFGQTPPLRQDAHGDALPPHALVRLGTLRLRHAGDIRALAFSADGKMLASGGEPAGTYFHVWDTATGAEIFRLKGTAIQALAFSADSKWLAAASGIFSNHERCIRIWDMATGKEIRKLDSERQGLCALAFSPDRKHLVVGGDQGSVLVWDTATWQKRFTLEGHEGAVCALAVSSNGKWLASGGGDAVSDCNHLVILWDLATGKRLHSLKGHEGQVRSLAFAPDNAWLASGGLDGSNKNRVRLWDPAAGKEVQRLQKSAGRADLVRFAPDGKTLFALNDKGEIRRWDTATGSESESVCKLHSEQADTPLALSADGKLLASAAANTVCIHDATTGKRLCQRQGHEGQVKSVVFLPDDGRILTLAHRQILVWDVKTQTVVQHAPAPPRCVGVGWTPQGYFIADVPSDGQLFPHGKTGLHTLHRGLGKKRWSGPAFAADGSRFGFSPDGKILWTDIGNATLAFHTWPEGKELGQLPVQLGWARVIAFSPDGACVLTGHQRGTTWWKIATQEELTTLGRQPIDAGTGDSWVDCRTHSPDGRLTALGYRLGTVQLWESATGKLIYTLQGPEATGQQAVTCLAFSPDGQWLAAGGADALVRVWELATGKLARTLTGHDGKILSLTFSADGILLASAASDTTALVWDISDLLRRKWHPERPSPADLEAQWACLAKGDAQRGFQAVQQLVRAGSDGAVFLGKKLHPAQDPHEQTRRWIADLDSDSFPVRSKASQALADMGRRAELPLRKVLRNRPTLETKRRVEVLLAKLPHIPEVTAEELQLLRALQALEIMGSPEAAKILSRVAQGAREDWLTLEAQRIGARRGISPAWKSGR